ncbi:hypothetical protein ACMFMG_005193 [Clarireedia jacksonii]
MAAVEQLETEVTASTHNSQGSNIMPPPITLQGKKEDRSSIKTHHPNISMGMKVTALISALSSQNLNNTKARQFLTWLQDEIVVNADGLDEPMLIPIPAPRALDLAFPFAVVEGKAYSTGKQIFEAENQAAVSGACALKIQLDLNDLVKPERIRSGASSPFIDIKPALFFSVCTEGPIHELWVHWTIMENGVRMFQSKLEYSCNALLLEQGKDLPLKLNDVGLWGTGSFMESVAERLGIVAKLASQS